MYSSNQTSACFSACSLFSAFFWLLVLLLTTAVFRGFVPVTATQPAYAGTLLAAVAIEELARYGLWQVHKRALVVLHRMSLQSGHTFTKLDELYLALGWGYGHAAVHVLFLFGSLLPLMTGHGTVYSTSCPDMSVFLVGALNSLGLGATLVALSVISLDGWSRGSLVGKTYAPVMHAGAALVVRNGDLFALMRPLQGHAHVDRSSCNLHLLKEQAMMSCIHVCWTKAPA